LKRGTLAEREEVSPCALGEGRRLALYFALIGYPVGVGGAFCLGRGGVQLYERIKKNNAGLILIAIATSFHGRKETPICARGKVQGGLPLQTRGDRVQIYDHLFKEQTGTEKILGKVSLRKKKKGPYQPWR